MCVIFVLLTIDKILNPFSLAADFRPVRTDIFVSLCRHFSQKALGHPCRRGRIASYVRFATFVKCEGFVYIFARPENLPVNTPGLYEFRTVFEGCSKINNKKSKNKIFAGTCEAGVISNFAQQVYRSTDLTSMTGSYSHRIVSHIFCLPAFSCFSRLRLCRVIKKLKTSKIYFRSLTLIFNFLATSFKYR